MSVTHEVTNQAPPLVGHDPIAGDAALSEACLRHADADALASLTGLGALAGSEQAQEWGRLANENPPRLRTHDRYGHRVDEVDDASQRWRWTVQVGPARMTLLHWVTSGPDGGTTTGLRVRGPLPLAAGYAPAALVALHGLVRG